MLRRLKERHIHFIIIAFLTGLFLGINVSFLSSASEPEHTYLDYFHRVYQLIVTEYVDEAPTRDLFFGAIRGMLGGLNDPYTRFLDEKSFDELKEMTTGKFQGVGIEITFEDGRAVVVTPIDGSPAMKAGVQPGDVITHIDGKEIKGMKIDNIIKMIRGIAGTTVSLRIKREGFEEPLEFLLERVPVKIASVESAVIQEYRIGYLRIKNFGNDTSRDVASALKSFNDAKIGSLVIDLRNNPGGLFSSAVETAELFLDRNSVVVSTRGREGSGRVETFKTKNDPLYRGRVIVLVNNGSASASEILAAALRDNNRAKLLGVKTFGKGSVQKTFNLDENIGIAITVARYYTPAGEMIHKKGIAPDYEVEQERFSESDMKGIRALHEKKLLERFAVKQTKYTQETRESFHRYLEEHQVVLSPHAADFVLKEWLYRHGKRPVYDLEFDRQLNEAVKRMRG